MDFNAAAWYALLELDSSECGADSVSKKKLKKSDENLCFGKLKKAQKAKEVFEFLRPRCYTDPGPPKHLKSPIHKNVPLLAVEAVNSEIGNIKKESSKKKRKFSADSRSSNNVFGSLIKQTLNLTTASMGIKSAISDDEQLTHHTSTPLNEDVKRHFSRSTNSVVTLPNATEGATSNDSTSINSAASTLLPSHDEAQGFGRLNGCDETSRCDHEECNAAHDDDDLKRSFGVELRQQHKRHNSNYKQQNSGYYSSLSNDSCQSHNHKKRVLRTLKQNKSDTAITSQSTLGLNSLTPVGSSSSVRSASPTASRLSVSGSISSNNSDNTAKNEQSTAAAVGSTTAVAAAAGSAAGAATEKEKKRKEVSSSRVKKFHRHFTQVPKDEKLINYFSCALVGDILLQGHLYITDQHFAFYSNVFGYVTKVVIPTSSVTKISKEKTAKIIPNAVGVATADERHVFGSFISREAAFRLMCSVCPPMAPAQNLIKTPADIEISEEYSIEDDSSCSISGNESPPGNNAPKTDGSAGQTLLRRTILSSSLSTSGVSDKKANHSDKQRHSDIPLNAKATSSTTSMPHGNLGLRSSAPAVPLILPAAAQLSILTTGAAASAATNLTMIIAASSAASTATTASSTPSTASSSPTTVMATPTVVAGALPSAFHAANSINSNSTNSNKKCTKQSIAKALATSLKAFSSQTSIRLKFPTELSIVYLGVILSLVLAVFSVFLLYRIVDIETRASQHQSPINFNWRSGHDDDILAEALRWQRELQDKSTAEAQSILSTNLEQIAKVRRSLETLSMLIRDRSSVNAATTSHNDESD